MTQNLSNRTEQRHTERQQQAEQPNMSGIAAKLQYHREKSQGVGSNSQAVKYLNQDFEELRRSCLERHQLFEDNCFEPLVTSLGYKELGPGSYKVRGITWKRPTVSALLELII